MIKENQILEIAQNNNGIVTTKLIGQFNIPRIYITKLIREKKLYRLERGVYSTSIKEIDPYFTLQNKSKKIVYSHFTSLEIQNFYKNVDNEIHISVPQGYNAKGYKENKIFYNSINNYRKGVIHFYYKGQYLKIYDIERCVCDIIKDHTRFDESQYNKFINYYFNLPELNYKKLLEYSKMLRISKVVHHYLSLFKA